MNFPIPLGTQRPMPALPCVRMARRGCILGVLLAPLQVLGIGVSTPKHALGTVSSSAIHPLDRETWQQARAAGQRCLSTLIEGDTELSAQVLDQVAGSVTSLMDSVDDLAKQLARARSFLASSNPEAIAKERADLELQAMDAPFSVQQKLQQAQSALEEQARHMADIEREIPLLSARLTTACKEVQALHARLGRLQTDQAAEELSREISTHREEAQRALTAYAATAKEIAALR